MKSLSLGVILALVLAIASPSVAFQASTTVVGSFIINGASASRCLITTTSTNVIASMSAPCVPTAASFVIAAVGGATMTITAQTLTVSYFAGQPLTITDGTNTVVGTVFASVTNSTTFQFRATAITTGAVGNTMATGATITAGGAANGLTFLNGAAVAGNRTSLFNGTAIANGGSHVYTYGITYLVAPVCSFALSAQGNTGILGGAFGAWVSAISTTTVTVNNGTGVSQTPNVICAGF